MPQSTIRFRDQTYDLEKMDRAALLALKQEVDFVNGEVKTQITEAKRKAASVRVFADGDWLRRAEHASRVLGAQSQRIQIVMAAQRDARSSAAQVAEEQCRVTFGTVLSLRFEGKLMEVLPDPDHPDQFEGWFDLGRGTEVALPLSEQEALSAVAGMDAVVIVRLLPEGLREAQVALRAAGPPGKT